MKFLYTLGYQLVLLFWRFTHPITLGVRLLLTMDDRVMLVKHTYQRCWYMPGGRVKKWETLEQAARREAQEELGAKLGDLRLYGMYTSFFEHKSDHVAVFVCEEFNMSGETDAEIERFADFHFDALPDDISPGCLRRIEEYRREPAAVRAGHW
jgi:8-oxo-dGTP pyrophosphatase MutT (NUDIX family)